MEMSPFRLRICSINSLNNNFLIYMNMTHKKSRRRSASLSSEADLTMLCETKKSVDA